MNFSALKESAARYLGVRGARSGETEALIGSCLEEAEELGRFRFLIAEYQTFPAFLGKEPYLGFLAGCGGVALVASTLGAETDVRIRRLFRTDPARAVVLDACASALLEAHTDEAEERLGTPRTSRFCPGYGGSPLEDVREIFGALRPETIGMQVLPSGLIVPQKSMAGVVGIGQLRKAECGACVLKEGCAYRKEGKTCYGSERK